METRVQKHKKYRESLIKQDVLTDDDLVVEGKHSGSAYKEILPFNQVIDTDKDELKKKELQKVLEKQKRNKLVITIIIMSLVLVAIIVFAVLAFGGQK